jgi:geranylgeranyl diphosphate synthase type II
MNYEELLKERIAEVEGMLETYLPKQEGFQTRIAQSMAYSLMAGGKRLRPIIMEEAYKICGGRGNIAPFMAALEMIHTYSLVHDDLPCMDNDEYRRGKETTWKVYGEDFGTLCGDALLNYAFETAAGAFDTGADPRCVGRALQVLAGKAGIGGMLGGQALDVWLTDKPMDAQELDYIYRLKTGALIESALMIGAILGGADEETVQRFEQMGAKVGMAFQIRDDILDLTSTTEVLGKPVLSDEKNHKTTYVTLYGMEQAQKEVEQLMEEAEGLLTQMSGDTRFLHYIFQMLVNRKK